MFKFPFRWLLPAALLAAGLLAQAQTSVPPKADPLDAKASVPRVVYQSSLARYQRYAEQPVGSWREANETVNRIGGWRAYAREASQADAPAASSTPAAPASRPATAAPAQPASQANPAGHAGHKQP